MLTQTNESAELDNSNPSNKKAKVSSGAEVLLECGVTDLKAIDEVEKTGCELERTPQTLRGSIHGLLLEINENGVDVDNDKVLKTMETLFDSETDLDIDSAHGKIKNGLLRKMLLPLTSRGGVQDTNMEDQFITQMSQIGNDEARWVTFDSSLIKVLLRVEALQPSLLVCLITKLQQFAALEQDDEVLNVIHENMESFASNEEIPRLIISHIRWMELMLDPISLVNAALECITFFFNQHHLKQKIAMVK